MQPLMIQVPRAYDMVAFIEMELVSLKYLLKPPIGISLHMNCENLKKIKVFVRSTAEMPHLR